MLILLMSCIILQSSDRLLCCFCDSLPCWFVLLWFRSAMNWSVALDLFRCSVLRDSCWCWFCFYYAAMLLWIWITDAAEQMVCIVEFGSAMNLNGLVLLWFCCNDMIQFMLSLLLFVSFCCWCCGNSSSCWDRAATIHSWILLIQTDFATVCLPAEPTSA